jgi:RNA polymerase sigma-70 factor (ECF subfamily)
MSGRAEKLPSETAEHEIGEAKLASLVARIAEGNETALAALYDATNRGVMALAVRILRDEDHAEEVLLDVYMQVWRRAAEYSAARGKPSAWLLTIARTRAIDRLRAKRSRSAREEPIGDQLDAVASADDPEAASARNEGRQRVLAAIATLPAEQKRAIELAFFPGLSHAEIAAKLGEPLGTVKTRIRLGMMKLREVLTPFEGWA